MKTLEPVNIRRVDHLLRLVKEGRVKSVSLAQAQRLFAWAATNEFVPTELAALLDLASAEIEHGRNDPQRICI